MSGDSSNQLSNKIYVGDLPTNITDEWLNNFFSEYGTILEITKRVFQKTANAFITFSTHEEAEAAIRECNYTKINSIPIRISWFDPSSKDHDPMANLVISNLPTDVDEQQLHSALEDFGFAIKSCRIQRNRNGVSNGIGYVSFESQEVARNAKESIQNLLIKDTPLHVEFYTPVDKRQDFLSRLPTNVICVEGPTDLINENNLKDLFKEYGVILNTFVIDNYGIVLFENQAAASRANAEFHHDKLSVLTSVRRELQSQVLSIIEECRVYLADIAISDNDAIKKHLEQAGKIVSLEIHDRSGGERAGLAQYETKESRNKAISTLNHTTFGEQVTPIRVLPFYEKRLTHQPVGLLQLNEVEAETTYDDLLHQFSAYGTVISISIVPTIHLLSIGYILFDKYDEAKKAQAESGIQNTFLYPPLNPNDVIGGFCDNLRARTVVCYGLPKNETEASIDQQLSDKDIRAVIGLYLKSSEKSKTAFITLMTYDSVVATMKHFKSKGIKCDLLGYHILIRVRLEQYLKGHEYNDIHNRLIYCRGVDDTINSRDLRQKFEETIGPVEFAMIQYNGLNGDSERKAIVLFKEQKDAEEAIRSPLTHFNGQFTASQFMPKNDYTTYVQQVPYPQQRPVQQFASPREFIRMRIEEEAPADKKQMLLEELKKLYIGSEYIKIAKSDFNGVPEKIPGYEQGLPAAISFKPRNSTITKLTNETADSFEIKIGKAALAALKRDPSLGYQYLPMTVGNNNTAFITTDIMHPLPSFSLYLAYLFSYLPKIDNPITLVVPDFWTETQRDLLFHACSFLSIPVLTIIDEITAVSIGYAASKTQRFINRNSLKPYNVMFIDIGYMTTKILGISFEWDGKSSKCIEIFTISTNYASGKKFHQELSQKLNISEQKAQKLFIRGSKNQFIEDTLAELSEVVTTGINLFETNGTIDEIQVTGGPSSNSAVMSTIKAATQNLTAPIKKEFSNSLLAYGGVYSALQLSGYSPFPNGLLVKKINKNTTLTCQQTHMMCIQGSNCSEQIIENSTGCKTIRLESDPRYIEFGVSNTQDIDLVNISNITFSETDKPFGIIKMRHDSPRIRSIQWCKNEGDCYPINFKSRYPDEDKYIKFMIDSTAAVKSTLQKLAKRNIISKIGDAISSLFERSDSKLNETQKAEFDAIADDYNQGKFETYGLKRLNETYYKLQDLMSSIDLNEK
ncbi:polyadenylate-binding protein 4-like [Histomonas meleagridis]|uniref:polyadenylate-binding protein 4-like n=1 Tax=Histomonas meleagridis TaxID=135588 RepID=UPI00355A0C01|nr:polyadenylate-binding protein 4-like [Histomonas meleagridis]KAH0801193.1 polyadenylate-binding protein 4-like [Histomonas meleagridis]